MLKHGAVFLGEDHVLRNTAPLPRPVRQVHLKNKTCTFQGSKILSNYFESVDHLDLFISYLEHMISKHHVYHTNNIFVLFREF